MKWEIFYINQSLIILNSSAVRNWYKYKSILVIGWLPIINTVMVKWSLTLIYEFIIYICLLKSLKIGKCTQLNVDW